MKIKYRFGGAYNLKGFNVPLAPCPFCGSNDKLTFTRKKSFDEIFKKEGGATISIKCDHCYAELYEHDYHGNDYVTKVKLLIKKWNTRGGDADEE